ncbi:MAG: hypothetical protein V4706_01650 [Pseudomonadota bacterium]
MKCTPGLIITDQHLVSSTIAEPVAPATAWVSGTVYAVGAKVSVAGTTFREYQRKASQTAALWVTGTTYIIGALRNSPANGFTYKRKTAGAGATDPASDPTNWQDLRTLSPHENTDQWTDLGPYEREWVSGATYVAGDEVIRTNLHRTYLRRVGGAGDIVPELDPTNWKDIGATIKYALFDLKSTQQTVGEGPVTYVIDLPSRVDSVGLTGLSSNSVQLQLHVGATLMWSKDTNTLLRNTLGWKDYFLGAFRYRPAIVFYDVPLNSGATLTITLTGGTVKCGRVFIGRYVDMGSVSDEAENDVRNFSKTEADDYGDFTLVERPTKQTNNLSILAPTSAVDKLRELRVDTNAKVALYSALDDEITSDWFNAFLIPGFWTRFAIRPAKPDALVSINLQEV